MSLLNALAAAGLAVAVLPGAPISPSVEPDATTAETVTAYTLDEMMEAALKDEHQAHDGYLAIMEKFSVERPFSRIVKAEERHIAIMEDLYEKHGQLPEIETKVTVPQTLEDAFTESVQAEKANIAMYDKFLAQDLPDDVRDAFTKLKKGSEHHLAAFERGANHETHDQNCGKQQEGKGHGKGHDSHRNGRQHAHDNSRNGQRGR